MKTEQLVTRQEKVGTISNKKEQSVTRWNYQQQDGTISNKTEQLVRRRNNQ